MDYNGYYIEEIDNQVSKVNDEFRYYDYKNQKIIITQDYLTKLKELINIIQIKIQ